MVARKRCRKKGQSLLEFALLMPIIVMMIQVLIQVESAISTGIVNQKYARSTLHYLMFNHRNYMEYKRFLPMDDGAYMRRYWVGVDDKTNYGSGNASAIRPEAPVRKIGRQKPSEDDTAQAEYPDVQNRQNVRVRVTTFTCIPPLGAKDAGLFTEGYMREDTFSGSYKYCSSTY